MRVVEWIKHNKLAFVLIVVLAVFVLRSFAPRPYYRSYNSGAGAPMMESFGVSSPIGSVGRVADVMSTKQAYNAAPGYGGESANVNVAQEDRKVVEENSMSMQVKDVSESIQNIKSEAEDLGGFMVSANLNKPMESSSGVIVVRVPSAQSEAMLSYLRANAVKVVSENLSGYDVTDQYSDIDAKLAILIENKATMESFMRNAKTIDEMLRVQNQIFSLQDQIDALVGQKRYLENVSNSVRIVANLSTDEYALPYAPSDNWSASNVFKAAVRSLVVTLRGLAERLIWLTVFAVIWIPVTLLVIIIWKAIKKHKAKNQKPKVTVTLDTQTT